MTGILQTHANAAARRDYLRCSHENAHGSWCSALGTGSQHLPPTSQRPVLRAVASGRLNLQSALHRKRRRLWSVLASIFIRPCGGMSVPICGEPHFEKSLNFQQVKPRYCDVFIWVAVWRDKIRYWVLASREVETNRYYSVGQHRGNVGEGQLHITQDNIAAFSQYEAQSNKLLDAILEAYERQHT